MDLHAAAKETAQAMGDLGGSFMTDGATYVRGAELGFSGFDYYLLGRGGVLGETTADVVAAGFIFWNPEQVRARWEAGSGVMSPVAAATEWAATCAAFAEANLPDVEGLSRLGDLLTVVVNEASPANASLFAGWRSLPVPGSPKARVLHQINAMRELRGALHGGALLAAGVSPLQAVAYRAPQMAPIFGWDAESVVIDDDVKSQWKQAESGTNIAVGQVLAALNASERAEFVELLNGVLAAYQDSKEG